MDALSQVEEQGVTDEQGFWVVVFPEGTRIAVGAKKRYKVGGAYLANKAGFRWCRWHKRRRILPPQRFREAAG